MGLGGFLFGNTGWQQGNIATEIAKNDAAGPIGLATWQQANNPLLGTGSSGMYNNHAMQWGNGDQQGYLPWLQDQTQGQNRVLNAQLGDPSRQYMTDPMAAARGSQMNYGRVLQPNAELAGQVFAGGGWTPGYQYGQDKMQGWMENTAPMAGTADATGTADRLLGNNGQTNFSINGQDRAMEAANAGGWTPQLNPLLYSVNDDIIRKSGVTPEQQQMAGLGNTVTRANLGTNGLTQTGAQGENTALGILNAGGRNATTNGLQGFGTQMATQNPLMSPAQAMSFAQDNAGRQYKNAAESQYAKAMARGGGPGANVANGAQNRALADFSDQGAAGTATAVQQALLNQQQLQLGEQRQATDMALGGGQLQNAFLGTGGGILNGLENTANGRLGIGGGLLNNATEANTQRLLGGYGAMNGAQGAATNNLQAYNQLGVASAQNETSRMNTGLSAADILQRGQLGSMGQYNAMMGNQNQYALGAGALQNSMTGTGGNLMSQLYNNEIGAGQLGLNQGQGYMNAYHQGMQNNLGLAGQYNTNYGNYANPLTAVSGQGDEIYRQYMANLPAFAGAGSNMVGNGVVGNSLQAAAGGLSHAF